MAPTTPRDSQRIRVYRAETPLGGRRLADLPTCAAFIDEVVGSLWWADRFPDLHLDAVPRLRPGNGARQAFYREDPGRPTITLPRRYRTTGVVLHELSHWALRDEHDLPHHGRTFTRLLLDVTAEFAGAPSAERLQDAYAQHKVHVGEPARRGPDGRWRYGWDERLHLSRGRALVVHHGDDACARGTLVSRAHRKVTLRDHAGDVQVPLREVWDVRPA